MFKKIIQSIKNIYKDYKYESLMFKSTEEMPPKWERYLATFILFAVFYSIWASVSGLDLLQEYPYIYGFSFIIFNALASFLCYRMSKRGFKNIKAYYKKRTEIIKTNPILVQKRFIFTTYLSFKTTKPVINFISMVACGLGTGLGVFEGAHKWCYPNQQTPIQQGAEILRGYTGYPPDSWDLPEVKAQKEFEVLKEQMRNQELRHQEELQKMREEIQKRNSRWW